MPWFTIFRFRFAADLLGLVAKAQKPRGPGGFLARVLATCQGQVLEDSKSGENGKTISSTWRKQGFYMFFFQGFWWMVLVESILMAHNVSFVSEAQFWISHRILNHCHLWRFCRYFDDTYLPISFYSVYSHLCLLNLDSASWNSNPIWGDVYCWYPNFSGGEKILANVCEFIAIRFAFLGSEIVKEIENSFVHGETQEFQIVFQDPAQRQELCIGGHHFEVTWVTWIVPVSKWQKLLGWNLLVQVHVFTFEHLEVGRLNSGRENVHRDWRRDEKGGIRDKTSDEYDQGWCRWLILVFGCFDVLYLDVLMFFAVFEWWLCRHRAPLARTIGCQWMNWMNKNLRRNDSIVAIASLGNQKGNYQMYSCVD